MDPRDDKEFVDGLARGLAVIEAFDAAAPELTLSEIARRTGHSPAAVRRSLFTLTALGYMRRIDRRFVLTPKILILGAAYFQSARIEEALIPELRGFVTRFGDAASVGVLVNRNILYIGHQSSSANLRPVAGTGVTYPAHATSMGRVLLAALPPSAIDDFLEDPLQPMTDVTVTDPGELRDILTQVAGQDFATVVDQLAYGVTSLAVPVRMSDGRTIAAVNTSGYSGRVTPDSLVRERLEALREIAGRIGRLLQTNPVLLHSLLT